MTNLMDFYAQVVNNDCLQTILDWTILAKSEYLRRQKQ